MDDPAQFSVACTLPSATSAADVVNGRPGALIHAAAHTLGRAALIGTGLWVSGIRGWPLVRGALCASFVIETFVLTWMAWQRRGGSSSERTQVWMHLAVAGGIVALGGAVVLAFPRGHTFEARESA